MPCPSRQACLARTRSSKTCPCHGCLVAPTLATWPVYARHYLHGAMELTFGQSSRSMFGLEQSSAACCRYVSHLGPPLAILTTGCKGSDIELHMEAHVNEGIVCDPPPPSSALIRILASRDGTEHMTGIHQLRFRATTHGLHQAVMPVVPEGCSGARQTSLLLWLPEPIARRVLPKMVAAYHAGHHAHHSATGPDRNWAAPTYIDLTSDDELLILPEVIDLTTIA